MVWCVVGTYLGQSRGSYVAAMDAAAKRGDLEAFWSASMTWERLSTVHMNALFFSFLMVLVGLVMPAVRYSEKVRGALAIALIAGVVLASMFEWLGRESLMAIGQLAILAVVAICFIGLIRVPMPKPAAE